MNKLLLALLGLSILGSSAQAREVTAWNNGAFRNLNIYVSCISNSHGHEFGVDCGSAVASVGGKVKVTIPDDARAVSVTAQYMEFFSSTYKPLFTVNYPDKEQRNLEIEAHSGGTPYCRLSGSSWSTPEGNCGIAKTR